MKNLKSQKMQIAMVFVTLAIFLFHVGGAEATASKRESPTTKKLASFSRVLSFDELTRLPKTKRVEYVRGLRKIMAEIDRLPPKMRASNSAGDYSQIAALLSLFDGTEALALDAADPSLPTLTAKGNVVCGASYKAVLAFNPMAGSVIPDLSTHVCVVGAYQSKACPVNTTPIRQQADGSFYCASNSSWNSSKLSDLARAKSRQPYVVNYKFQFGTEALFNDKKYPSYDELHKKIAKPVAAAPVPATAAQPTASANAEARLHAIARSGGRTTPPFPAQISAPPTIERAPAPSPAPAPAAAPAPASSPASDAVEIVEAPRDENAIEVRDRPGDTIASSVVVVKPAAPSGTTACEPKDAAMCDASAVESARKKYAGQSDKLACIYAGTISTYNDGVKRAYNCAAPTRFCYSATNCKDSEGNSSTPDYSCPTGKIICNPLLFGLGSDGKSPVCVSKGGAATSKCEDEVPADGKSPLDLSHAGLKEAWNEFADGLHNICRVGETVATLHCAECAIIQKRLFDLNVAVRDVKSCGDAVKFEDKNCDADGKCSARPGATPKPTGKTKAVAVRGGDGRTVSSEDKTPVVKTPLLENGSVFDQTTSRPK